MRRFLVAATLCAASAGVWAQTTPNYLTFSITTDDDWTPTRPSGTVAVGTTGNTSGEYGNRSEWISARTEFDLTGLSFSSVASATLSFSIGYISTYSTANPYSVGSSLFYYQGDNAASWLDYQPPGRVGYTSFDAAQKVGQTLTFDVTTLVNAALQRGDLAFGVGQEDLSPNSFIGYQNYSLSLVPAVPEPSTYVLLLAGLALVAVARRQRRGH